jgi:FixJ family two-component response regulator
MVLDIVLPNEQGDSFFVVLKSDKKFQKLKVIVVSVIGDLIPQMKKIDPKVESLSKPFEKKALLALIERKLKE